MVSPDKLLSEKVARTKRKVFSVAKNKENANKIIKALQEDGWETRNKSGSFGRPSGSSVYVQVEKDEEKFDLRISDHDTGLARFDFYCHLKFDVIPEEAVKQLAATLEGRKEWRIEDGQKKAQFAKEKNATIESTLKKWQEGKISRRDIIEDGKIDEDMRKEIIKRKKQRTYKKREQNRDGYTR